MMTDPRMASAGTISDIRSAWEIDAQPRVQPDPPVRSSFFVVASVAVGRLTWFR